MRCTGPGTRTLTRRSLLETAAGGFSGLALAHLLSNDLRASDSPALNGGLHHPAKVKRVVQLFMNGGASQVDTFDYKPELIKRSGEKFDPGQRVESATST